MRIEMLFMLVLLVTSSCVPKAPPLQPAPPENQNPSTGPAPVPDPTPTPTPTPPPVSEKEFDPESIKYNPPLTITKGGTYSGYWQSTNSSIPAVHISTPEPVIIENSVIRGAGDLILSTWGPVQLTVRNTRGYGLKPTSHEKRVRRFVNTVEFKSIVIENNYLESTGGIYIGVGYKGNGSSDTLKILYNKVKNIDGRVYNGVGYANFVQLNLQGASVPGMEIAWNQVINEPLNSVVEDNINIFNSRGTPSSPLLIHNNYIEGAYPMPDGKGGLVGKSFGENYSGGGILADSPDVPAEKVTAHMHVFDNQMVSTMNYSFGIATGNNIKIYNNRAVTSDYLRDGRLVTEVIGKHYPNEPYKYLVFPNGYWATDYYPSDDPNEKKTFNNSMYNNVGGISRFGERHDYPTSVTGASFTGYTVLPVVNHEVQLNEFKLWQEKLRLNKVHLGPR